MHEINILVRSKKKHRAIDHFTIKTTFFKDFHILSDLYIVRKEKGEMKKKNSVDGLKLLLIAPCVKEIVKK